MAVAFWAIGKRNIRKGLVGENDLLAIDPQAVAEELKYEAEHPHHREAAPEEV